MWPLHLLASNVHERRAESKEMTLVGGGVGDQRTKFIE